MEKLSGLVLDIQDDTDGAVLKSIWPNVEDLPEQVKTAQKITPELEQKLPDHLYALVLQDEDVTLRKFACIDSAHTALSVEYFLKTAHKLPEEAQKVAAENLCTACGWYGIEPPELLQKIAIGLGGALMGAMVVPGAVGEAKKNLQATQGSQIVTPEQREQIKAQMGVP